MDKIRHTAMFAVGRAVFFGGFAISVVMLAFAFDFTLAFRAAAVLTLAMSAILLWYAQTVHDKRIENSEVWILLPVDDKPRSDAARRVFAEIMREVYLYYAVRAFGFAVGLMAIWLGMAVAGVEFGLT